MALEILVPKQEPAVHASAPFPTSLRRRGPDGQQDPPHGHHLHRTTSSITRTPTDDKRGVRFPPDRGGLAATRRPGRASRWSARN